MIFADDVVLAVSSYLKRAGYVLVRPADPGRHGHEIRAVRAGERLIVGVRGETHCCSTSGRYSRPLDVTEVTAGIAGAALTALRVVGTGEGCAALALPDLPFHRSVVEGVLPALQQVGIRVLWVDTLLDVTEASQPTGTSVAPAVAAGTPRLPGQRQPGAGWPPTR